MKVSEIMVKKPIVAYLPGNRDEVVKILVRHRKTGLPVVKKSTGEYAGFITRQRLFEKPDTEQLALLVMKDHPVVMANDSVEYAAELLLRNEAHHLPVLNSRGVVTGIVTPADFLRLIHEKGIKRPVSDYVRSPCVPIHRKTPLKVALLTMRLAGLYAFPVVDDEGTLVGLITDRDVFDANIIERHISSSDIGLGDDEDEWNWEGLKNVMKLYYETSKIVVPNIPVDEIMVSNPATTFKNTPVSEVAKIMLEKDYGQLPIKNEKDRLMAMIYELDLLQAILED
jgi:CBS domain-containing protein